MALLTKKEFADLAGLETKNLSVYIGRGKVVARVDDLIDSTDEINILFLAKRSGKGKGAPAAAATASVKKKAGRPKTVKVEEPKEPLHNTKLLEYEEKKKRLELEMAEYKMNKLSGALVPTEQVKMLFSQHFKSVYTAFESCFDNLLLTIGQKAKLSSKDMANFRTILINDMNAAVQKSVANSKKTIEALVEEYTETRGRGERRGI